VGKDNGFPLDIPDIGNAQSVEDWQKRVIDRIDFTIIEGITTGSNAETSVVGITLEPLHAYIFESWVLGVLNETGDSSKITGQSQLTVWRGGYKLNTANAATAIGSSPTKVYVGCNLGISSEIWTTDLTTSTNKVVQTVTGGASDIILWRCAMKLFKVSI